MSKGKEEDKEDFEDWLLSFERLAGKPVVVSLLVERGSIEFVACLDKRTQSFFDKEEEDDGDYDVGRVLKDKLSGKDERFNHKKQSYIG